MARSPSPQRPPDRPLCHEVLHLVADRADVGPKHAHFVGLETATGGEPRTWSLVDFVQAFRGGERFYLAADRDVAVEPDVCPHCAMVTIATHRRPTPA